MFLLVRRGVVGANGVKGSISPVMEDDGPSRLRVGVRASPENVAVGDVLRPSMGIASRGADGWKTAGRGGSR